MKFSNKHVGKAVSDFYGSKIHSGELHKKMHVSHDKKIPSGEIDEEIAKLKAKPNKTKAELKKEKELVFAKNARKFHKK